MTPQQRLERQRKQLKKRLGERVWGKGETLLAGAGDEAQEATEGGEVRGISLATLWSVDALPGPTTPPLL